MKKEAFLYSTLLALTTAVISGTSNFLNKIGVTAVKDALLYTTLKNLIVALALICIIVIAKKFDELKKLNRKQIFMLLSVGVIGGSLPFALFFTGLTKTSALNASLIHKTLFLWVILFSLPFLKDKIRWQVWLGVTFVFIANLFVGGFEGFKHNSGELMILLATLLWAIENIIAKKALKDISSLLVAGARMTVGVFVLILFVLLRSDISAVTHLNFEQWKWTLITSATLLGYVLTWYTALKYAPAWYVATLLVPATLVTNVLSAIFVTHTMGWQQGVSGGLYVVGMAVIIIFIKESRSKNQEASTSTLIHNS